MKHLTPLFAASVASVLALTGCGASTSHKAAAHSSDAAVADSGTPTEPAAAPTSPPAPPAPEFTTQQRLALSTAINYLQNVGGFSEQGLYEQLTSPAGEDLRPKLGHWVIRELESGTLLVDGNPFRVNWRKQAVKSAQNYVNNGIVSGCSDLLEQLSSSAGDQYTLAQAQFAARKTHVC